MLPDAVAELGSWSPSLGRKQNYVRARTSREPDQPWACALSGIQGSETSLSATTTKLPPISVQPVSSDPDGEEAALLGMRIFAQTFVFSEHPTTAVHVDFRVAMGWTKKLVAQQLSFQAKRFAQHVWEHRRASATLVTVALFPLLHAIDGTAWKQLEFHISKTVSVETLPDWLTAIQTGADAAISDDALANLVDGIWDLVDAGRLNHLNLLLRRMDVTRMPSVGIEALLRYTYSVRASLDAWHDLLDSASIELKHRSTDGDTETILSGLDGR